MGKGVVALLGAAALWLWHRHLLEWLKVAEDDWSGYGGGYLAPQIDSVLTMAYKASQNWPLFLGGILIYAGVRFIEAYGLWQDKTWAYWLSVIGYGVFVPIEIYYVMARPIDWFKCAILGINLCIVVIVYRGMRKKGLL